MEYNKLVFVFNKKAYQSSSTVNTSCFRAQFGYLNLIFSPLKSSELINFED